MTTVYVTRLGLFRSGDIVEHHLRSIEAVHPGAIFYAAGLTINERELRECRLLLVINTAEDERVGGNAAIEVRAAARRGIPIIFVLRDGARMPEWAPERAVRLEPQSDTEATGMVTLCVFDKNFYEWLQVALVARVTAETMGRLISDRLDSVMAQRPIDRWSAGSEQRAEGGAGTLPSGPAVLKDVKAGRDIYIDGAASGSPTSPLKVPRTLPSAKTSERSDGTYAVWYGTNRKPVSLSDPSKGYSSERDTVTHYGRCEVYIPESHKIGSTGSSWWKRWLTMRDDRLKLRSIDRWSAASYWQKIRSEVSALDAADRHAVVFVHGYNVSFTDAALRAAQIGFDLSIRGPMAFFSWPSFGTTDEYAADEASIQVSEPHIAEFLIDFVERSSADCVHILAHSMGNRGMLAAVEKIATMAKDRLGKQFGQVILAAADVDCDLFRQRCWAYKEVASRTTLYVSERDVALGASRWLHTFPRVGLTPPVFIAPDIDTINVTSVDLTALGHGYIAEARDVLKDMHDLIFNGSPPERRFALKKELTAMGEPYWRIG